MGSELALKDDMGIMELGKVIAASGFFSDAHQAGQAVVKILAGRELGFGPVASMTGIYIVKGKVSLSANLMAAAIKRSGRYDYRVDVLTEKGCTLSFYECGKPVGVSSFTLDDAAKAGIDTNATWAKFPRNMLFARAMSNGARWYTPDIFGGPVYTPEELGQDVDGETGEPRVIITKPQVLEVETTELETPQTEQLPARPYSPEEVKRRTSDSVKAQEDDGRPIQNPDNKRFAVVANLEDCFSGDPHSDQKRHAVIAYLTGKLSSKELSEYEVMALHRWLHPTKDDNGDLHPDPLAAKEARMIAELAMREAGQAVMFDDAAGRATVAEFQAEADAVAETLTPPEF